jgi:crossover junction endonuclease MUS81
MSSAMVRLDPADFITLRKIEFLESQRTHGFVSTLRLTDPSSAWRSGQATVFAFIQEETAPPTCSKFESGITGPSSGSTFPRTSHIPTPVSDDDDDDDDDWVALPAGPSKPSNAGSSAYVSDSLQRTISDGGTYDRSTRDTPIVEFTAHRTDKGKMVEREPTPIQSVKSIARRPLPRLSSHVQPARPLAEGSSIIDTTILPDFDPSKAIVFPTGSYEIVLILDTREIESKNSRDRFAEKLAEKGVKIETRALRLGDVCWIARRLDGLGGEEDECVLDYVVERKRLDDLCSSIRDGRYKEQCVSVHCTVRRLRSSQFRLSNSGIGNVFYLVEDWQTSHHMEYSGLQIMTAKSQIQVHNRFILKETHKLSESIDYLATMTGVIRSHLQSSDLHIIPTRYLSRSSYLPLRAHLKTLDPGVTWHTSFQAYQDINDKSASATLRDKWARMLLCVKGMSAERVSAVIEEFETPRQMWHELKARVKEAQRAERESQAESLEGGSLGESASSHGDAKKKGKGKSKERGPDMFFADRIKGEGRRKIGDALSREVSASCAR